MLAERNVKTIMGDIFRRATLISGTKVAPKKKNRKRNRCINFHVSEEEHRQIENRIELSGLSKSEFFINSCLHQKITVLGNVKTFDAIKNQIKIIDEHLCGISQAEELDEDILLSLKTVLELLDRVLGERK